MQSPITFIHDHCLANGLTIAVAESVTAGYLQMLLSRAAGATQFFQGGITAYNTGQKVKHLGVEPIHAQSCNAISPQVAAQMALGVCTLFNSSMGLAVTGYAAPVPELGVRELYAYYAIACKGSIIAAQRIMPAATEPEKVMEEYAWRIIHDCCNCFREYDMNGVITKKGYYAKVSQEKTGTPAATPGKATGH
ncbi:CinA family protein [Chitinophaga japonensis]|uniref:PncC family amidohydrolase n=1 Tax=Chitinophaga japonensis TaxID=104662 RepID=A0A562TEM4_CHIJA|nr:CinA family protein [Chitinophaga japonensis]TWI91962.1 PncC family amidohydrolase [Chitinophaga japonensis]